MIHLNFGGSCRLNVFQIHHIALVRSSKVLPGQLCGDLFERTANTVILGVRMNDAVMTENLDIANVTDIERNQGAIHLEGQAVC